MHRRSFLAAAGSTLALAACQQAIPSAPGVQTRVEVNEFAQNTALVASLRKAVAAMMAITNGTDQRSWTYWHYSHWAPIGTVIPASMSAVWDQCRHGKPYFFAWHRGFVLYFELMLKQLSGNSSLMVPYWDWYANPTIPQIFAEETVNGKPNPLYWSNRENSTVSGLGYAAYDFTTFESSDSHVSTFESVAEQDPHGLVHDLIGGDMGTVPTAAADPLFWVHHCNVDRLWSAWLAAGGGRMMPPSGDPYYTQTFAYDTAGDWTLLVGQMVDTSDLGYVYDNLALPQPPAGFTLPVAPSVRIRSQQANQSGALALSLPGTSVTIPLSATIAAGTTATLVLEGATFAGTGSAGGYAFGVYVNLPETHDPAALEPDFYSGTLGSFAISMEQVMMNTTGAVSITFDITSNLQLQGGSFSELTISFVGTGSVAAGVPLIDLSGISVQV
jgi:tyrosinase